MKYIIICFIGVLCVVGVISCADQPLSILNVFAQRDGTPPVLIGFEMHSSTEVSVSFDEYIMIKRDAFTVEGNEVLNVGVWDETLTLTLKNPIPLGTPTTLEGRVQDLGGNSLRFSIELWAKNTRIPALLINEFTTKGSENHPDRVELYILSAGNLAGVTIEASSDTFTFGDYEVASGNYVVVVFNKGSVEEGFFVSKEQGGLATNNGYICVAESPQWNSPLIDCVLYSTQGATTYNGFGSKAVAEKAEYLAQTTHWNGSLASDAVDISKATATRSVNRNLFTDTNTANDWYICATSNASFGSKNSTNRYD